MSWQLEFFRVSQASSYLQAEKEGALRKYPVPEPMHPIGTLGFADPFSYGHIAELVEVIRIATDMMEGHAKIALVLTKDGNIMAMSTTQGETVDVVLTLALKELRKVEEQLNTWLVDNTDQVFEEESEVDEARSHINDAILQLEGKLQ